MEDPIALGDKVRVYLDPDKAEAGDWFEGTVVRIEPYSAHRSFYWVRLEPQAQAILGFREISVFNPKNIRKQG
jgi:hypothetical protein